MDIEAVRELCELLGLKNIKVDKERGWVNASCPFAPFKHKNGLDTNPSFGISISKEDHKPHYKCFSCDSAGDLRTLLHSMTWLYEKQFTEAQEFIQTNYPEIFNAEEVDHSNKKKRIKLDKLMSVWEKEKHVNALVPEMILEKYPLLYSDTDWEARKISHFEVEEIKTYLENKRGINPIVAKEYQLRYFKADYGALGVIFPIMNRDNPPHTLDLWVRLIDSKKFFRLTANLSESPVDYHAPASWFGEHLFDKELDTVLVEGAFDALRLKSLGVKANVFACLGNPSKDQLQNPNILTRTVYLGFDSDEAGGKFIQTAIPLVHAPKLYFVDWSKVGKKDAGDLESKEEMIAAFRGRLLVTRAVPKIDLLGRGKS